ERREAREMDRNVRAEFRFDPARHVTDFRLAVVEGWHREVDDFQPSALLANGDQRIQNRLQLAVYDVAIVILREGFEVDLDGIGALADPLHWRLLDEAIGHDHTLEARIPRGFGRVRHVLVEDGWFVVGKRNDWTTILSRQRCEFFGRQVLRGRIFRLGLRDFPVLTELAVHVASRGGNRKGHVAGKKMEERLLLDGVDVSAD